MGNALRKFELVDFLPPDRPLSEDEVQSLVDQLHLEKLEAPVRRLVAADEERRLRRIAMLSVRDAFYGELRQRCDPTEAAKVAGYFRNEEEKRRRSYQGEKASSLKFRKDVERRSKEIRRLLIPVIDRRLDDIKSDIVYARNTAVELEALMLDSTLGNDWLRPEAEQIAVGRISVAFSGEFDRNLPLIAKRIAREELVRLAKFPSAPQLQLSPVGVTSTIWASWCGRNRIALLRREPGPDGDLLIALSVSDFLPVEGDGPKTLSGGASWLLNGRWLEISAANKKDVNGWIAALAASEFTDEAWGGEFGEESIDW